MSTKTKPVSFVQRVSPPRILLHPANPNGSSPIYRIAAPADAIRRSGFATTMVDFRRPSADVLKTIGLDAIVDQHPYTDEHLTSLKTYQKSGVFFMFDIDDLFWEMDAKNPAKDMIPKDVRQRLQRCSTLSSRITVSTEALADRVHQDLNVPYSKIVVLRNFLPQAFFTAVRGAEKLPRSSSKPRIGWTGSLSHAGDLTFLSEVVKRTSDKYQWVFVGSAPEGVDDLIEFHKAVQFSKFPTLLGSLNLDLGIVPLAHTNFNRCKSDLKILEYGAAGYPVMASRLVSMTERKDRGGNVWLVDDNEPDSWIIAIEDYFASGRMQSDAQELHDWVKQHGLIENPANLRSWARAWTPEGQGVFLPNFAEKGMDIAIVGEPVAEPHFATIAEARRVMPSASILYVRPGACPVDGQIESLIKHLAAPGNESTGENAKTFASVSALSNDGDYPVPGKFTNLEGSVAANMAAAALVLDDTSPIPVPYSSSPAVLLASAALSLVGIPDEDKYDGDIEIALIEWSLRVNDLLGGAPHIVAPDVFVPVPYPSSRPNAQKTTFLSEIAVWHPNFPQIQKQAAEQDFFKATRKAIDLSYSFLSYEAPNANDYPSWLHMHDSWTATVDQWSNDTLETWKGKLPRVGIVMPTYNTNIAELSAAIQSVRDQTYMNWRLVIVDDASTNPEVIATAEAHAAEDSRIWVGQMLKNGHISKASNKGLEYLEDETDWVLFLDHDDMLTPNALFMLVERTFTDLKAIIVYGDSDLIAPDGTLHSPDFKPDFDYDLFLAQNYICHPCMYKFDLVKQVSGFREGYEGSQDYDLALRYLDAHAPSFMKGESVVAHVPMILYHWRQSANSVASSSANKTYAIEAAQRAVVDHLNRLNRNAFVGTHPMAQIHNLIRYLPPDPAPEVSIIVLTQSNRAQLEKCIGSLLGLTVYPNFQVIVRQVGSDPGIAEAMNRFAKLDKRVKFVKGGGEIEGSFNYALLNNAIAKGPQTKNSEILVFLNDDTQILEAAWLNDMVGAALRPEIGAVGAKLLFPDNKIQHAGIILDASAPPGERALHLYYGLPHNHPGPCSRGYLARQMPAVTAACMAIRKSLFEEMKGFDALEFPLDYNDVDLCLRLFDAGYKNLILSHIVVQHVSGSTKRLRPDAVTRTGMLLAEDRLTKTDAFQSLYEKNWLSAYSNLNIGHEPTGQLLRVNPARPWKTGAKLPVTLFIGGTKEEALTVFTNGELPVTVLLDGPYMEVLEPILPHVGRIDVRERKQVDDLLDGLGITRIVMRRLGKGSFEALGLLRIYAKEGLPVFYSPADYEAICPRTNCINSLGPCNHAWKDGVDACQTCVDRDGSDNHGYTNIASYRHSWNMFNDAIKPYTEGSDSRGT